MDEFIYWAHSTPVGVKIEEVSGMVSKTGKLWREMALQIFCEHGPDSYRDIGHFPDGAPFIFGLPARISISHTDHLLVVAMLPKTPETDLSGFSLRCAMGVDAERLDRMQVLKVRERFLSENELTLIGEDLEKNIIAWTCKEALYKAALIPGLDFRQNIIIEKLPYLNDSPAPGSDLNDKLGKAFIIRESEDKKERIEMDLYSYKSEDCCITIAISPKSAKFKK